MIRILLSIFVCVFGINGSFAATGGVPVNAKMKTSIVNLLFERGMCSGVVLENSVIITAAHCGDMLGAPQIASWLGGDGVADCAISDIVDQAFVPGAEPILPLNVHAPDLMLLKLATPLCGTVPAAVQAQPLQPGDRFFQGGHGSGSGDFYTAHQVELEVITTETPEDLVEPLRKLGQRLLARGSDFYEFALPVVPQTSACQNDSGGPSFVEQDGQMLLYGVNGAVLPNENLGAPGCNNFYLHLLAPVAPYYDWITKKVADWSSQD